MDETHLSLRFKHGIHTIFLFVDPLQPFSALSRTLLSVLRERYPDRLLTTSRGPTRVPDTDRATTISYACLRNPANPDLGWLDLGAGEDDTPAKLGVTENMVLAFAVHERGKEPGVVEFVVDWPRLDEEDFVDLGGREEEEGDVTVNGDL